MTRRGNLSPSCGGGAPPRASGASFGRPPWSRLVGILSCFLEHETRNADVDIWGETRYGHPPLQSGFFFFDKWKFSLKLEEMLHNGRSKGRVQAVDLLTEHLTMDIKKVEEAISVLNRPWEDMAMR